MANPFTAKTASFGMPGDFDAEQRRIDYERKLAEQLAADTAMPQGGMVGPVFVRPSITQYLAKALNPMMARSRMDEADRRQKQIDEARTAERTGTLERFSKALAGTPASPGQDIYTDDYTAVPAADQQGYGATPAIPGDRNAAMAELGRSRDPMLQNLYMAQMLQGMKPGEAFTLGEGQRRFDAAGKEIAAVAPKPTKMEKPFIRTRVMGEQEIQEQLQPDGSYQEIGRGPRFARQVAPVVNVGGPAGKVPAGYRATANGDLEAIPGGPADVKAQAVAQRQADGATDVDVALGTLRDAYNRLESGGGITSTKNSALSNAAAATSSSAIGQAAGKLFGTQNQSARNDIAMARPALLAALMKATGMSAKQMDSNAELKLWLSTATDPALDVESNRRALENIERKYIKGGRVPSGGSPQPVAAGATGGWGIQKVD
jgi:hypothetical protein